MSLLMTLMVLSSCGPIVAVPGAASDDAPMQQKSTVYLLHPGDVIKLTVYDEDTLTDQYTLDWQGFIAVPLIGSIKAGGLSQEEIQTAIASALVDKGYLQKPLVTVDIIIKSPFYILGEIKNPGSYPWQPSLDVFKAIATAGGYTPRAAQNKILIDRDEGTTKLHLNATENTPVMPGDSITVRERIF